MNIITFEKKRISNGQKKRGNDEINLGDLKGTIQPWEKETEEKRQKRFLSEAATRNEAEKKAASL